ncbi:MAG: thiamine phosphate synthase [Candidatus Omnitrophica bacterium]|nr:thiamine phosphate synthase [Candidatus Omnitrophota bacterium]
MLSKKKLLQKSTLYAILDPEFLGKRDIEEAVEDALRGGADIIQYRDKQANDLLFIQNASRIRYIVTRHGGIFIINDRVPIAKEVDADGVHIGAGDLAPQEARTMLGPDRIIGLTTHSLAEIERAPLDCIDYISVGPVFLTKTKPSLEPLGIKEITNIISFISLPFFIIGGITVDNLEALLDVGATRIAVIGAIFGQENIRQAASALKQKLSGN